MNPEIQLQIIQLIFIGIGVIIFAGQTFLNREGAKTEQVRADTKKDEAVTSLALMNNQERKELSNQVLALRDKVSYAQGQHDEALRVASTKIEALEKQMKDLGTTYESRIKVLENEIRDLNTTIAARDETISGLEKQVKILTETVSKFLTAQAVVPPHETPTNVDNAAIAAESSTAP